MGRMRFFVMLVLSCTLSVVFQFVGLAHARPPQGPLQQVNNLIVVDSAEKKVGNVLDLVYFSLPEIVFSVKGYPPFALTVFPDRLAGPNALLFASSDCSGTPYMLIISSGFFVDTLPVVATGPPGHTVYIADTSSPVQQISPNSEVVETQSFDCQTVDFGGGTDAVFPAIPLIDLNTKFMPPFQVRSGNAD